MLLRTEYGTTKACRKWVFIRVRRLRKVSLEKHELSSEAEKALGGAGV